ncbi:MAG: TetR family transcriptional regulator [Actinocrinis sp.]
MNEENGGHTARDGLEHHSEHQGRSGWHGDCARADEDAGGSDGARGAPPGLRERKKLATREALSAAAIRLAAERGFENLRVEDIAEAAGVSPRTFNNYFSSREQAISAARIAQIERIAQALAQRPAEEALLDALTNATLAGPGREPDREVLRLFACNPTVHGEMLRTAAQSTSPLIEAIAKRTGTEPTDLLPYVVASAVFGAMRAAMHTWLAAEPSPPYQDVLRDALNQLRALTATPQAAAPNSPAPPRRPATDAAAQAETTGADTAEVETAATEDRASVAVSPASARPVIIAEKVA